MTLGATIYNVEVERSDTDRQVYESVALRVARHPSESEEYLPMLVNPIYTLDRNLVGSRRRCAVFALPPIPERIDRRIV